jgi:hypothetical protein
VLAIVPREDNANGARGGRGAYRPFLAGIAEETARGRQLSVPTVKP